MPSLLSLATNGIFFAEIGVRRDFHVLPPAQGEVVFGFHNSVLLQLKSNRHKQRMKFTSSGFCLYVCVCTGSHYLRNCISEGSVSISMVYGPVFLLKQLNLVAIAYPHFRGCGFITYNYKSPTIPCNLGLFLSSK